MAFAFSIYSTDNSDPGIALDSTSWGPDPNSAEYDPEFEWAGRGSHTPTLGGVAHQDYGFNIADRKIRIKGTDMSQTLRDAIDAKNKQTDVQWNFTDGNGKVYRVRFSRVPRGFVAIKNEILYAKGLFKSNPPDAAYTRFTYEIILLVTSQIV